MTRNAEVLSRGLRTLELFARHAPLDLDGFARLAGLSIEDATTMMTAFEQSGYVRRTPGAGLHVPTSLALDRMVSQNLLGTLVSRAIDPVVELARATGGAATLSIRRDGEMLCCIAAGDAADGTAITTPIVVDGRPMAVLSLVPRSGDPRDLDPALRRTARRLSPSAGIADALLAPTPAPAGPCAARAH